MAFQPARRPTTATLISRARRNSGRKKDRGSNRSSTARCARVLRLTEPAPGWAPDPGMNPTCAEKTGRAGDPLHKWFITWSRQIAESFHSGAARTSDIPAPRAHCIFSITATAGPGHSRRIPTLPESTAALRARVSKGLDGVAEENVL